MNKEKKVMKFLLSHLLDIGDAVHFTALVKAVETASPNISDFFDSYTTSDQFHFFRDHEPYFSIANDGYVSAVNDQVKESKVIEFLLSEWLQQADAVHYTTLVRAVGGASYDIRDFFSSYEPSDQFHFFRDNPEHFLIANNGYVSAVMDLEKKEEKVIQFLLSHCLKPGDDAVHFTALIKSVEEASPDISDFFLSYETSDQFHFFRDNSEHFSIANSGYVSAVIDLEKKEEKVIQFLLSHCLKPGDAVHFTALIKSVEEASSDISDFFLSYETSDQFHFFRDNSEHFSIANNGYVSVANRKRETTVMHNVVLNKATEKVLIKSSKLLLKESGAIHFEKLVTTLEQLSPEFEDFFQHHSTSDKYYFFKDNSEFNVVDGYVSAQPEREQHAIAVHETAIKANTLKEKVITFFVSHLKNISSSMHYEKLVNCLETGPVEFRQFFRHYSVSQKFSFFKENPEFLVGDNGYVSVLSETEHDTLSTEDLVSPMPEAKLENTEEKVNEVLLSFLKDNGTTHYKELLTCLSKNRVVNNFFLDYSSSKKFNFFKASPFFFINFKGFVSLNKRAQNKLCISPAKCDLQKVSISPRELLHKQHDFSGNKRHFQFVGEAFSGYLSEQKFKEKLFESMREIHSSSNAGGPGNDEVLRAKRHFFNAAVINAFARTGRIASTYDIVSKLYARKSNILM